MGAKTRAGIGQGSLWTPGEIKSPTLADLEIEPGQVITISRLLRAVSGFMDLPLAYATQASYDLAQPATVHRGLYIERHDLRYRTAENLYNGVVFPSKEFGDISRSPQDMARHAKNKVRKSFSLEQVIVGGQPSEKVVDSKGEEVDRDEIEARVMRGAGHQLERYAVGLERRHVELSERRLAVHGLVRELQSPGKAHYRADNLDKLRVAGERAIREAVEVASINMDWGSVTVDGLHQAVMYKIYGLPGHNNMRLRNFLPWAQLAHNWMRARIHGIGSAMKECQRHLAIYQPHLDAAETT